MEHGLCVFVVGITDTELGYVVIPTYLLELG